MAETDNTMLENAITIALHAHTGQVDKNGEAYILHPLRVMADVRKRGGSVEQQAAAVLHDVVEDCDVTQEDLRAQFPISVCDLVLACTHPKDEPYMDYLGRIVATSAARLIKECDIGDNYWRLGLVQDETVRLHLKAKYEAALAFIAQH